MSVNETVEQGGGGRGRIESGHRMGELVADEPVDENEQVAEVARRVARPDRGEQRRQPGGELVLGSVDLRAHVVSLPASTKKVRRAWLSTRSPSATCSIVRGVVTARGVRRTSPRPALVRPLPLHPPRDRRRRRRGLHGLGTNAAWRQNASVEAASRPA